MKLQKLLKNIEPIQIIGDVDVEVSGINIDSRKIKEGHLFVAIRPQVYTKGIGTGCKIGFVRGLA